MATALGDLLLGTAWATALAGAARSTWSPCGLSMLSSLTPFGERSRGHRYAFTAGWFIAGAAAGGASLGVAALLASAVLGAMGVENHRLVVLGVASGAAICGAALDAGSFGQVLPLIRRQVNDRWLARYRSWAYAGGFGWQIGVGVATYVMTSAVLLMALLASLSARPLGAFLVATGFGTTRGATVLLTGRVADPASLRRLHRKLDGAASVVLWGVVGVQGGVGVILAAVAWFPGGLIAATAGILLVLEGRMRSMRGGLWSSVAIGAGEEVGGAGGLSVDRSPSLVRAGKQSSTVET